MAAGTTAKILHVDRPDTGRDPFVQMRDLIRQRADVIADFVIAEIRQFWCLNREVLLFFADFFHRFHAIGEGIDFPLRARERAIDAFQDKVQRHTLLFPAFDENPVQSGQKREGFALRLIEALNLGEVVEVV